MAGAAARGAGGSAAMPLLPRLCTHTRAYFPESLRVKEQRNVSCPARQRDRFCGRGFFKTRAPLGRPRQTRGNSWQRGISVFNEVSLNTRVGATVGTLFDACACLPEAVPDYMQRTQPVLQRVCLYSTMEPVQCTKKPLNRAWSVVVRRPSRMTRRTAPGRLPCAP